MIGRITQFFGNVKTEMEKVSWPSSDELMGSTGVVLAFSFAFAVIVFIMDFFFGRIMGAFLQ